MPETLLVGKEKTQETTTSHHGGYVACPGEFFGGVQRAKHGRIALFRRAG